jgi:hypothetical protein
MSNQNRNVPFLTKLEMAPFCVFHQIDIVNGPREWQKNEENSGVVQACSAVAIVLTVS